MRKDISSRDSMTLRLFNRYFSARELWRLRSSLMTPAVHPRKGLNFILNYVSRRLGMKRAWGLPPFIMIEPTARCDMDCPICFVRAHKKRYPIGDISLPRYRTLMNELGPSLITLALWGYGEPLLNRELPAMIALAKQYEVFTSVSTNAYSMDAEMCDGLIDSGLDYLIASVDGASEETYSRYRSPHKFHTVLDNVRLLCQRKRERGRRNPFVEWQFIVMAHNEQEVPKARALASEVGVDKFTLKKAWVMPWNDPRDYLPEDTRYHLKIYSGDSDRKPCSRPWSAPLVTWRGDITVCCADFAYGHIAGNVYEQGSFAGVWNNDAFRAFRGCVTANMNSIDICRNCAAKNFRDGFVDAV